MTTSAASPAVSDQPRMTRGARAAATGALTTGLALAFVLGSAAAGTRQPVAVHARADSALGGRLLIDAHGAPLYTLSNARAAQRIVRAEACLVDWTPVSVSASERLPADVPGLALGAETLGRRVVLFQGSPLFSYRNDVPGGEPTADRRRMDGGNWRAAVVPRTREVQTFRSQRGWAR
jgi:predicted lipoprotein with Yx(FWY)xxD motif